MVFDLDPDKGLDLEQVRRGVRDLKDLLDELSLTSFLKTSGGKGYHVVVPFEPASSWDAFRQFARRMAQVMAEKWPDRYTSNVPPGQAQRQDIHRLDAQTAAAPRAWPPYSLRARPGAHRVGPPRLGRAGHGKPPDAHPPGSRPRTRRRPLDPWKGYFEVDQGLG